ncbi:MAG: penicillin-binding transpeptidase domain-containing protein, partial [Proteobacteria bacterium]|nr:penicillin-binding transpeptidase domain-containing protein [Pseudomonadota bacterium]
DVGGDVDPAADPRSLGVSAASLELVQDGMARVVNSPTGTGFRSRITQPGMEMAGKTGTSQVRSISAAERAEGVIQTADRPWEERDHAVFVGYAPINDPRYAISVVIEHGGGGASAAAPVAHDILLEAQQKRSAARRNQFADAGAGANRR